MAGQLTLEGMSTTEAFGSSTFGPYTVVGNITEAYKISIPLLLGDNTINVPAQAVAIVIVPPATSPVALTYRTSLNFNDSGLPIAGIFYQQLVTPIPNTVIITAQSGVTAPTTIVFI